MSMVCPTCGTVYEQRLQCAQCGVRLVYRAAGGASRIVRLTWKQTSWGRLIVGLIVAQGLYYGLRHLFAAAVILGGDDVTRGISATLASLVLVQALQGFGVFVAGVLAGAGQRQGALYGALVGLVNGLVLVGTHPGSGKSVAVVEVFGQPLLMTVVGTLGGLGGMLVWRGPAALPRRGGPTRRDNTPQGPSPFAGKIAWGRVLFGILVSVSGTVLATVVLKWILDASKGELSIQTELQSQVVICEICVLMMIAGSALAGANTRNGMKQGIFVGLGSGVLLSILSMASAHTALKLFSFTVTAGGSDVISPLNIVLTVASAVSLGLVGGWFGADLLPPLVPRGWKPFRSHPV